MPNLQIVSLYGTLIVRRSDRRHGDIRQKPSPIAEEHPEVSEQLVGRLALKSHQLVPGTGAAVEMSKGDLLQILTLRDKTIADLTAIVTSDHGEVFSVSETRSRNNSIMFQEGFVLVSNRGNDLFTIVEDSVGRHDTLLPACSPATPSSTAQNGAGGCREAIQESLSAAGITTQVPIDPVHWFMNVAILQRGELEIRESLAEPNDYLLLRAEQEIVAAVTACDQVYGDFEEQELGPILIRVFK